MNALNFGIIPAPRVPVSVRPATLDDLPFMDQLQKQHGKALGYFTTKQYQGYIEMGAVLVGECDGRRVGYIVSRDRYLKRDELGVIFQLCVAQGEQRKLIGAALVREVFARSAYGCRLYCLWCAQDLPANRFWESMGFVPIAFRAGSSGKRRVHIFWQKRINDGDAATPWWYPCATNAGAIREDRLVFPIPPGTHWKDVQAVAVPAVEAKRAQIVDQRPVKTNVPLKPRLPTTGRRPRVQFGPPSGTLATPAMLSTPQPAAQTACVAEKPARERAKKQKVKVDPKLVAAARELRDRYLEHVNSSPGMLESFGKYEVTRQLTAPPTDARERADFKQLPHAA